MGLQEKLLRKVSKSPQAPRERKGGSENLKHNGFCCREYSIASLDGGKRQSRAALVSMIAETCTPLRLVDLPDDSECRLGVLCFNAIAVELRDLFRILEGLHFLARKDELLPEHISTFYLWFEGFFGIITTIFDNEEDVLFPWIEKVAALEMENALAPKRRKTKKDRTRDMCWDILELKMQFESKVTRKISLTDLVWEMRDEAEQLCSRILMYVQALVEGLPLLVNENFGFDESRMVEASVITHFRASEEGTFVICAYAKGIADCDKRNSFLVESFQTQKSSKNGVPKQTKKFQKRHADLADSLALRSVEIEPLENC